MKKTFSTDLFTLSVRSPISKPGVIMPIRWDLNNGEATEKDDFDIEEGIFNIDRDDAGDVFFGLVKKFALATKAKNGSKFRVIFSLEG